MRLGSANVADQLAEVGRRFDERDWAVDDEAILGAFSRGKDEGR